MRILHSRHRGNSRHDDRGRLRKPCSGDDWGCRQAGVAQILRGAFHSQNAADTVITPVSLTCGDDQVVDEMLFQFTHTIEMDWMLPGIAPTGRPVKVPLVAIVKFREGKLAHEHIYWDQASVLAQIGLLDSAKLPICGIESARKVLDPKLPANQLIDRAR